MRDMSEQGESGKSKQHLAWATGNMTLSWTEMGKAMGKKALAGDRGEAVRGTGLNLTYWDVYLTSRWDVQCAGGNTNTDLRVKFGQNYYWYVSLTFRNHLSEDFFNPPISAYYLTGKCARLVFICPRENEQSSCLTVLTVNQEEST